MGKTNGKTTHYEVYTKGATNGDLGQLLLMLEKIKQKVLDDFDDEENAFFSVDDKSE